nr:TonB-dependent receptor [Rikenellaceae bacterium]
MKKLLPLMLLGLLACVAPLHLLAQGLEVSGRVTNAADGTPIIGATVIAGESKRGTSTTRDGRFTLSVMGFDKHIEISFLGMQKQTVQLTKSQSFYEVVLEEEYNDLDAVVVTGYGSQLKRDITGAITSLSADDIEVHAGGNINTALQGKIPGMQIVNTSGEPGAGANISIRGLSSINGNNEPLYIIDGVAIESSNVSSLDGDATFSPMAGLDVTDIESIEVLKDAASAAIYGSRAANGVIIITTKGGRGLELSDPVVNVSHTSSIVTNSRNLDVLSANQFREIYIQSRLNNGKAYPTNDWVVNPNNPYYCRSTDWQDVMFRPVYQHRENVSLRGSNKNFSYNLSFSYKDQKPTIVETDYKQYNIRANFNYRMNEWLKGYTSVSYAKQDYNRVLSGSSSVYSVLSTIVKSNPCYSPYDPETGEVVDYMGGNEIRNPLALAMHAPYNYKRDWSILNQRFDVTLAKGLELRLSGSLDTDNTLQDSYMPERFNKTSSNPIDTGRYKETQKKRYSTENYLMYNYKKGGHRLTAMAGMSILKYHAKTTTLNGQEFIDSEIHHIQNAGKLTNPPSVTEAEYAELSFFGRLNYTLKDRYIFAFTLRRDGSSRFGKDNRFGNFPAVQLGWRFSDEKFMRWATRKDVLSDAKLRATWGVTGNNSIGNYASQGSFAAASSQYEGNPGLIFSSVANHELKWEKTTQYNVGLDLSFFRGRLLITADAYLKESDDLLYNFPSPYYTGFSSFAMNFGSLENRGMEFLIETVNLKGGKNKLRWSSSFNISFNRSKVKSLPTTEPLELSTSIVRVGQPIGLFYGHRALGVYAYSSDNVYKYDEATGQPIPYRKGSATGDPFKGGDVCWYDADDNGVIDDNDRVVIGDPNPKFIGGFSNNFAYKGFSLNILFQFSYGNDVLNEFNRDRDDLSDARNTSTRTLRAWKHEGDVTDVPMVRYSDPMDNYRVSNMFVEDGSYLRLKDVTLAYTLKPKKLFKTLRISFTATNLLTWSKYTGYDPEVNTSSSPFVMGVDKGAYPKARSYNFGIEATF